MKSIFITSLTTFLFNIAPTQAKDCDLLQAYQSALTHDPRYAAAKAQLNSANEIPNLKLSSALPYISLGARTHWNKNETAVGPINNHDSNQNSSYNIQLTQPIFRPQNLIDIQQGNIQHAQAQLEFMRADQELVIRVAESYLKNLNAIDAFQAANDLYRTNEAHLLKAEKNFSIGESNIIESHEAKANLDRSRVNLTKAKSNLDLLRFEINQITRIMPCRLKKLPDNIIITPPEPLELHSWLDQATQYNIDVQLKTLSLNIADNDVRMSKSEHLPTVDLVINKNISNSTSYNSNSGNSASIGLVFNLPIYSGGRHSSTTLRALALRRQSESELDITRNNAASATKEAWSDVISGIEQTKALETAKASALIATKSTRLGYELGIRFGIEIMESFDRYTETSQDLSRNRHETLLSKLKLRRVDRSTERT
ncbi:TolC family protein [Pseudomonas fluorescens]|uniref:TolC family protein n=1 Tax=Pseudomonas fluorescens TaxID=294 RepID=UPI003F9AF489